MADGIGLGVMGWPPMAAGILTGKYRKGERARATDFEASVRHADNPNNDTAIDAVSAVDQEAGAKPGQVAVAVTLSDDQVRRLDAATVIALGYPHDLNSSPEQREAMTGGRFEQIDYPTRVAA